jgi:hypothetical protein
MAARIVGMALVIGLLTGCAGASKDVSPLVRVKQLARVETPYAALHACASDRIDPMIERESRLAGITLGQESEMVKRRLGTPTRSLEDAGRIWWEYELITESQLTENEHDNAAHLITRVGFSMVEKKPGQVEQIQVWAPSREQSARIIRPLDPAIRITAKYGVPPIKKPWGNVEAWVYPEANLAFVMLDAQSEDPAVVAGIVVGL